MVEMTLMCAVVGEAGRVFGVKIEDSQQVWELAEAIAGKLKYTGRADQLQLFLAKHGKAWQPDDDSLDAVLQSEDVTSYLKMRASWKLNKSNLFGPNVPLGEDVIHVLVVAPKNASSQTSVLGQRSAQMSDAQQVQESPKKPKLQKYVAFTGPVREMDFSVPLDTISAFQRIKEGFSGSDRPLYLLYGPRQFGKTTIANGIRDVAAC